MFFPAALSPLLKTEVLLYMAYTDEESAYFLEARLKVMGPNSSLNIAILPVPADGFRLRSHDAAVLAVADAVKVVAN